MNEYRVIWTIAKEIKVMAENETEAKETVKRVDMKTSGGYILDSGAIVDVSLTKKAPADPLRED